MWRSVRRSYSGPSWGTTVETIAPSREPEAQALEREQVGDRRRQLVRGRAGDRGQPPVAGELLALEGAEVGLGVADVDREQHRRGIIQPPRLGCAAMPDAKLYVIPGLTPVAGRRC